MADGEDSFDIIIEFSPSEGDPARVFKTMSGLIDSIQAIDRHLISSIDTSIQASLVLEDIERGSLKAKLRSLLEGVPDEALEDVNWKKIVGPYLVTAKKRILTWCGERDSITDREAVRVLEGELVEIAQETELKALPAYAPIPVETLLSDIRNIQDSLIPLESNDSAMFQVNEERIQFNRDLEISNEIVREVLTSEVTKSSGERVLKVKKPDYLGQSMWSFVYDGRAIDAKITDEVWLAEFQTRKMDVRPGDAVRVILYEEIYYGYDGEIVHRHYEIESVRAILRPPDQSGMDF
jgi:hypothetical protein